MARKLTSKQRAFADEVISGANPSEAYRAAYSTQRMSAHAVSVEAQKLLKHPVISRVIEEGRAKAAENAVWSREIELERLSAVNDRTYRELTGNAAVASPTARLFTDSIDRLHSALLEKEESEGERHEEYEAEIALPIVVDSSDGSNTMSRAVYERLAKTFAYFGAGELFGDIPVVEISVGAFSARGDSSKILLQESESEIRIAGCGGRADDHGRCGRECGVNGKSTGVATVFTDNAAYAALQGIMALYIASEWGLQPAEGKIQDACDAAILWFQRNRPEGSEEKALCSLDLTREIYETLCERP